MDAADLRIFAAVARTGSMSKAASELGTVQSNVTARIRALEDRLGVELFERTNRGATLTAAGLRLRPYADRVAGLLEDAKRAVADEGTPSGALTMARWKRRRRCACRPCSPSSSRPVLPSICRSAPARHTS